MLPQESGKIDKLELYRQFPPRSIKDKCNSVLSVMTISPILKLEREKMGATRILQVINDGIYLCIYRIHLDVFKTITSHAFYYDSHFSKLQNSERSGAMIDDRFL